MTVDPREEARQYIEAKGVTKLFQELGTRVMFERPNNPSEFLLEVLGELQAAKKEGTASSFFTGQDVEAMFSMFDPTGKDSVSVAQYRQALKSLGIDTPTVDLVSSERVPKAEFTDCIMQELEKHSLTSKQA
ncbi:unnamed protein product [Chrysoparadoxa australica]